LCDIFPRVDATARCARTKSGVWQAPETTKNGGGRAAVKWYKTIIYQIFIKQLKKQTKLW